MHTSSVFHVYPVELCVIVDSKLGNVLMVFAICNIIPGYVF